MPLLAKPLSPKKFDDKVFMSEFRSVTTKLSYDIKKDFEKTVATWERKPKFTRMYQFSKGEIVIFVSTDNKVYGWLDQGTEPHAIFPGIITGKSNKKSLYFQWGGPGSYKPKTIPNIIDSGSGGPSGEMVNFAYVWHPGTDPRNFDDTIRDIWEPIFKRRIEQAISRANKASGHRI